MNPQRHPLPPLPAQLETPARPDLSTFTFSSRIGTPTLLTRMGHGAQPSFGRAVPPQQQILATGRNHIEDEREQSTKNGLLPAVGVGQVNSSGPQVLQPMNLDVAKTPLSPDAWKIKSPPPLNVLALNDLWADASRVQNEWASVERPPITPVLQAPLAASMQREDVSITQPNFQQSTGGLLLQDAQPTQSKSSGLASSNPRVLAKKVKTEEVTVKKEESEVHIKTEDDSGSFGSHHLSRVKASTTSDHKQVQPVQAVLESQPTVSQSQQRDSISAVGRATPKSSSQGASTTLDPPITLEENIPRISEEYSQDQGPSDVGSKENIDISDPHPSRQEHSPSHNQEPQDRRELAPRSPPQVHTPHTPTQAYGHSLRLSNVTTDRRPSRPSVLARQRSPVVPKHRPVPNGPRSHVNHRGDLFELHPRSHVRSPPRQPRTPPPYSHRGYHPDPRGNYYDPRHRSPRQRTSRSLSPRGRSESPRRGLRPIRDRSPPSMPVAERRQQSPRPRQTRYSPPPYSNPDLTPSRFRNDRYNRSPSPRYFPPYHSPSRHVRDEPHLPSPTSSGSRALSRGRTPHHFARDSPPQRGPSPKRIYRTPPAAHVTGSNSGHFLSGPSQTNYASNGRLHDDSSRRYHVDQDGRPRYERQHAQGVKRNLDDADLHDEASRQQDSSVNDSTNAKRRRLDLLNEGDDGKPAISTPVKVSVGNARQSRSPPQAQGDSTNQDSEQSAKPLLWSRMAGNSSSSLLPPATTSNPLSVRESTSMNGDIHVPALAYRMSGPAEDRLPVSRETIAQNVSSALRVRETLDSGTAPVSESSSGGKSLSDRIHSSHPKGVSSPQASFNLSVPSQPRRASVDRPNVPLVNRLGGASQAPLPHQIDPADSQSTSLANRIAHSGPVNGHSASPYSTRGGYGANSSTRGPRHRELVNGSLPSGPLHDTNPARLADRLD